MSSCPSFEALSEAVDDPTHPAREHAQSCLKCGRVLQELTAIQRAARALADEPRPQAEVDAGERELIASVRKPTPSSWVPRAAALAAAAILGFALAEGLRSATEESRPVEAERAETTPTKPHESKRTPRRQPPSSVANVEQGSLQFKIPSAERPFETTVADGSLISLGAIVRADVAQAKLQSLHVLSGRVELRIDEHTYIVTPNRPWNRLSAAAEAFTQAQAAFTEGRYAEARGAYQRALDADATGAVAEEALYWRMQSELQLKQNTNAEISARRLLKEHPAGLRTAEAHLFLARALLKRGARKEAAEHAEAALEAGNEFAAEAQEILQQTK